MRVAVLATGGKDSALALHRVLTAGHEVTCLLTMIPLRQDSWMFHYPNINLIDFFAQAVEYPLVKAETSGVKEEEVEDLRDLVKKADVDGVVSGAIASTYQKTRVEKICNELGLACITPLWQEKPIDILNEILELKFEAIITGVSAHGLSIEWLGRRIDEDAVEALAELNRLYGVSLVGEGGEYETIVLDASFFKKRIRVVEAQKVWEKGSGYFLISKAQLEDK